MSDSREVLLKSGAKLVVNMASFKESNALFKAYSSELKDVNVDFHNPYDLTFLTQLVLRGISSDQVRTALDVCMQRCTYNNLKIDDQTFESVKAREDYMPCAIQIAIENIKPFMKGLYALSEVAKDLLGESPA